MLFPRNFQSTFAISSWTKNKNDAEIDNYHVNVLVTFLCNSDCVTELTDFYLLNIISQKSHMRLFFVFFFWKFRHCVVGQRMNMNMKFTFL